MHLMKHGLVASTVIGLACPLGCEERAASPGGTAASGSASESREATQGGPPAMDWNSVTAARDGSQIMAYKTLARMCDAWHKGGAPAITLRYGSDGKARDDAGNSAAVSPEEWEGIVDDARRGDVLAVASESRFYSDPASGMPQDTFGTVPRFKYAVEVIDSDTLTFANRGNLDDGR